MEITATLRTNVSSSFKFILSLLICQSVGIFSQIVTLAQNEVWFDTVLKPTLNPPDYLFVPFGSMLYLLMGISLWFVWKSNAYEPMKQEAMLFFTTQLLLNFSWTILFFKFHSPLLAFIDILALIVVLFFTIFRFSQISKTASWLLVPYISWVCFTAILNYNLWKLTH